MADLHPTEFDSFVARHVRKTLRNNDTRQALVESLEAGQPYVEKVEFGVVVMVDISGYTNLTSRLAKKGKVSSELVTKNVNQYLIKLIDIISYFQGDIVRFLGDALLVTFTDDSSTADDGTIVLRAMQCCSQILRYYPKMEISHDVEKQKLPQQTDQYETSNRIDLSIPSPTKDLSPSPTMARAVTRTSRTVKGKSDTNKSLKRSDLRLHIGIAAGPLERLFIGTPKSRMDYFVQGDCIADIGPALDKAHAESMGMPRSFWETYVWPRLKGGASVANDMLPLGFRHDGNIIICENNGIEFLHQTSHYANQHGPILDFVHALDDSNAGTDLETCERRVKEFVEGQLIRPDTVASSTYPEEMPSIRATIMLCRFINKSIVKKLSPSTDTTNKRKTTTTRRSTINSPAAKLPVFQSEFRTITVLFVKFDWILSPDKINSAMVALDGILSDLGGVYQQSSADDKGLSILACFGLPPLQSENIATCALLAGVKFSNVLDTIGISGTALSLGTGEILFSVIGNSMRAEAGLLGDVVNISARMLSVKGKQAKNNVVCDESTHSAAVTDQVKYLDLGLYTGKEEPQRVYEVQMGEKKLQDNVKSSGKAQHFGYSDEKQIIASSLNEWMLGSEESISIYLEGPGGMGKSSLAEYARLLASKNNMPLCLVQGSEIDLWNPFYALVSFFSFYIEHFFNANGRADDRTSNLSGSNKKLGNRRSTISTFRIPRASQDLSSWTMLNPGSWSRQDLLLFLKAIGEADGMIDALLYVLRVDERNQNRDDNGAEKLDLGQLSIQLESIAMKMLAYFHRIGSHPVIMVDDCHYIDSSSAQVIHSIITQTNFPLCTLLLSRPLDNYPFAECMAKIRVLPFVKLLVLHGLTEGDIEKFITWKLDIENVLISPNLIAAIKTRSNGNPIFVEFLINIVAWRRDRLKSTEGSDIKVFSFNQQELDDILSYDVTEAINLNFDRVHPDLQELLKILSIFGMQFSLMDVRNIWNKEMTEENIAQIIMSHDSYSFLVLVNAKEENDDMAETHSVGVGICYGFRHQTIMEAIYERLPYGFRAEMHNKIGEYFESHAKGTIALPLLSHHFSRSNNLIKKVRYLEKLSFFYSESFSLAECISTINQLMTLIDESQEDIANTPEISQILDDIRQANLLAVLAWTHALRMSKETVEQARKSLAFLSQDFPSDEHLLKKLAARTAINLLKYLSAILKQTVIHMQKSEDYFLVGSLLRLGFALSWVIPGLARIYVRRALEIVSRLPPIQLEKLKGFNHLFWMEAFRVGDNDAAYKHVLDYIENRGNHRDHCYVYVGNFLLNIMDTLSGNMTPNLNFLAEIHEEFLSIGMHEYTIWGTFALSMQGIYTGNFDFASFWLEKLKLSGQKIVAEQLHTGKWTAMAMYAYATKDFASSIEHVKTASHCYGMADRVTVGYFVVGPMLYLTIWGLLMIPAQTLALVNPNSKVILLEALNNLRKTDKHLGVTLRIWSSWWGLQFGNTAIAYIKNPKSAASVIKRALKDEKKCKSLAKFTFIRMMAQGVLAKVATDPREQTNARGLALDAAHSIRSPLIHEWLRNG
ncbi:hypothetical protein HDU97_005173 [Phlyctochytrium planicorne]|nr:hypothetical protein HDU97_005173 [Phlyctochytrium planicorne]